MLHTQAQDVADAEPEHEHESNNSRCAFHFSTSWFVEKMTSREERPKTDFSEECNARELSRVIVCHI